MYDLERKGFDKAVDAKRFYDKYIQPLSRRLKPQIFQRMVQIIDTKVCNLNPSKKNALTWCRAASLIGYQQQGGDLIWQEVGRLCHQDEERCNIFVGSLIYWRIALITSDTWLTQKTKNVGDKFEYRAYWINNSFMPLNQKKLFTVEDLQAKFQGI